LVAIKISFIAIPGIRFSAPILSKYFIRYTFNVKQILARNNPKKFPCKVWLCCVTQVKLRRSGNSCYKRLI
jgi:hypothetical protein